MAEQVEKSFQKQPLFHNSKVSTTSRKVAGKDRRWYKEVGLGFKTPREAIEGTYIDKKCPFTGLVSIRGRILTGKVVSTKMTRTIVIRREYLHFVPNSPSATLHPTISTLQEQENIRGWYQLERGKQGHGMIIEKEKMGN
ncbi:uncharacterized protein JCM6883_002226 [Sporobolomyces salmoneus]|uniref:uncharacterized protein n=1 Tax=Sporobolomyces salmoneus TaxID=183962 RepID=UPI003180D69E